MANQLGNKVTYMDRIIQVMTTGDSRKIMEKIGECLVEQRLAACAQISGPITSTYWWKGKVEVAEEWVCTVKTTSDLYAEVEAAIKEFHPYETPEIIAVNVENSLPAYADWVRKETGTQTRRRNT